VAEAKVRAQSLVRGLKQNSSAELALLH